MLPEVGAAELIVIAAVALIVVGPKDLPVLMRKIGGFMTRMRGLAAEFRASFDEMARQSELDELRKEVEALRRGTTEPPAPTWRGPSAPSTRTSPCRVRRRGPLTRSRGGGRRGCGFPVSPSPGAGPSSRSQPEPRLEPACDEDAELEARARRCWRISPSCAAAVICVAALAVGFVVCFAFAQPIYLSCCIPSRSPPTCSRRRRREGPTADRSTCCSRWRACATCRAPAARTCSSCSPRRWSSSSPS